MELHEILHLEKAKRVGIMGGTFDPIHQGHLVTAEAARSKFNMDKVVFIPSGQPPHKRGLNITSKEYRYIMTVLATAANPYFDVSRTELDRPGESYAIDTVRYIQSVIHPDGEIFFITGVDAILEIVTWKDIDELFAKSTFIAATRPGYNLSELNKRLQHKLSSVNLAKIIPLEVPAMAISSTDIRERVRNGRTIKYLLPESVENFIKKNELYL